MKKPIKDPKYIEVDGQEYLDISDTLTPSMLRETAAKMETSGVIYIYINSGYSNCDILASKLETTEQAEKDTKKN